MFAKFRNILLAFVYIVFFSAPLIVNAVTCDSNLDGKTDQELQAISAQCDADITSLNNQYNSTKQYSSQLEQGLAEINYNISKIQLEIEDQKVQMKQLNESIDSKTQYIGQLSDRMSDIKDSIGKMLQDSYSMDNASIIDVLLSTQNLSEFFSDTYNYASINAKLQALTLQLQSTQKTSENEKTDLKNQQSQVSKLEFEQEQAKQSTENYKSEQQSLLSLTQNAEAEYSELIAEKEKLKNEIRDKLYKTASGEEISFGDALKLIQPYESDIGVNSALILAVLFQESSMGTTIGNNIGECYYNQPSTCSPDDGDVMSATQQPYFLSITSSLNLNPNITPVSCPICDDGDYGGAMGPAQFMPLTWNGISSEVSGIIGVANPSPFNNLDAFVASGVLLKENQDRCDTAFKKQSDIWACTAAKYYGGLALKGTKLTTSMYHGYGAAVLVRAQQFQKDINTLSL